jgi:hypothetical protein
MVFLQKRLRIDLNRKTRGGLISKSLCGIPYKKFFKIPQGPLFLTFCMGDYKSLAAIAALPQWPVRAWRSLENVINLHLPTFKSN